MREIPGMRSALGAALAVMAVAALTAQGALAADAAAPAKSSAAKPATKKAAPANAWSPAACPVPPAADGGPSSLKVTGPCAFEYKADVICEFGGDDYDIDFTRPAKDGALIYFHLSIEHYRKPGTSKGNEIKFSVQDKTKIYRWASEAVEVTVAPGNEQVTVRAATLEPEPVLVGCTGPASNYSCEGRGDEPGMLKSIVGVSGTLQCKPGGTRPDPTLPVVKE